METYGISLDAATEDMEPASVAALAWQLPQDCRWRVSYDKDMWWTGDRLLAAALVNGLYGLIWGMSDKKSRGPKPKQVGPSRPRGRKQPCVAMTPDELLKRLALPRKGGDHA